MTIATKPNKRMPARAKSGEERPRSHIAKITIEGFKSLKEVAEFDFAHLNVLVGANGAGKSNFMDFFDMLGWMVRGKRLQEYIAIKGGGDDLLHKGAKQTRSLQGHLVFNSPKGENEYRFVLRPAARGKLIFSEEEYCFRLGDRESASWKDMGHGHEEANIAAPENDMPAQVIRKIVSRCTVYQFHDTSPEGPMKRQWDASENYFLRNDGGNLAPVLLDLRQNHARIYAEIERLIGYVLPIFAGFDLHVKYGKVALRWHAKGKEKSFGAHLTSDGTLRLMALITLLNMPDDRLSDVLLLDEPELGLHPYAISLLGALVKRCGIDKQIIVATQSPLLVNEFAPEDIIVAKMDEQGATSLERLESKKLTRWLEEFQLGELWQKNVIGGNPQ